MAEYKHFLITRFNLKVEDWKTTKNSEEVRTDEWLENRFELFETYCLPSVINQSNQDFIWYVFFDLDTTDIYRNRVSGISIKYKNFRPIYIDGLKELVTTVKQEIKKDIDKEDFIITTRLDNDDIIHTDFIETIQKSFQPAQNTVIDVREGYQVSIEDKCKSEIREYTHPFNAFISVIEKSGEFTTILSKMHYDWAKSSDILVLDKKRLWIELVHQKNKMNSTLKGIKKKYSFNYKDFNLDEGSFELENRYNILLFNIILDAKHLLIKVLRKNKWIESIARRVYTFLLETEFMKKQLDKRTGK